MRSLLNYFNVRFRFYLRLRNLPLAIFILFGLFVPAAPARAEQWQKLEYHGYVNDFAGVLDAATVERLSNLCTEVDQKAHAQIAVVTIKTLEDETKEDFTNQLFKKWGVGAKGTDRGVMLLWATDDHKYWTEVGYGLEPILPDGKVGTFGRNMVPLLRQGNYNGAITQMVSQVAQVIAQDSNVSLDGLTGFQPPAPDENEGGNRQINLSPKEILVLAILFLIIAPILLKFLGPWFFISMLFGGGNDRWGGGGFGGGGGGGGFGGFGGGSSGGGGAGGSW